MVPLVIDEVESAKTDDESDNDQAEIVTPRDYITRLVEEGQYVDDPTAVVNAEEQKITLKDLFVHANTVQNQRMVQMAEIEAMLLV